MTVEFLRTCRYVAVQVGECSTKASIVTALLLGAPRFARQLERVDGTSELLGWTRYECIAAKAVETVIGCLAAVHMCRSRPELLGSAGSAIEAYTMANSALALPSMVTPLLFERRIPSSLPPDHMLWWGLHRCITNRLVVGIGYVGSHTAGTSLRGALQDAAVWLRDTSLAVASTCVAVWCVRHSGQSARLISPLADLGGAAAFVALRYLRLRSERHAVVPPFEMPTTLAAELEDMPHEQIGQLQEIATVVIQAQRVRHSARAPAATVLAGIAVFRELEAARLKPELEAVVGGATPLDVSDDERECTICLDRLEVGQHCVKLPCGHIFHQDCLRSWFLHRHVECPFCRCDVRDPQVVAAIEASRQASRGDVARRKLAEWGAMFVPAYIERAEWDRAARFLNLRGLLQRPAAMYLRSDTRAYGPIRLSDVAEQQVLLMLGLVPPRFFTRFTSW